MAARPDDTELQYNTEGSENIEDCSNTDGNAETTVPDSFNIFVVGKTGAGKSSLINSLLEKKVATVQQGPQPCKHDKLIEGHEGKFLGVPTVIYDTRGLGDESLNIRRFVAAFRDKLSKCGDRFLIFICQKYLGKFDKSVDQFVELLSKYFKRDYNIWTNSILVLTQANTVDLNDDEEDDEAKKAKNEKFMAEWGLVFQNCFEKYNIPEEIIQGMPVCIAGKAGREHLLTKNWKKVLFDTCLLTNQDKINMALQKEAEESAIKIGAYAGAVVGGIILPVIGAPFGMTVGALVGLAAGREIGKKKVKEREEKRFCDKIIEKLLKPGRFSFHKTI